MNKEENIINKFEEYLEKHGHGKVFDRILLLLKEVPLITGESVEEVLVQCDFKETELKPEKLESLLAELRSVVFLKNFKSTTLNF